MKIEVLTTDLRPGKKAFAEYKRYHDHIWPEVRKSLLKIGVKSIEIFRLGRRLVMIMKVPRGFKKDAAFRRHMDSHPRCREWEELMAGYQVAPPGAARGAKWGAMKKIFSMSA